jgi:hypothetical protein
MAKYRSRNLEEQRPFLQKMASHLRGIQKSDSYGRQVYKCFCPQCHQDEASFFTSYNGDTFIFKCHRKKCGMGSLSLHRMIMTYGSLEIQHEWMVEDDKWFGIKNRVTPGPKKKKSFKDSMQLKSECHRIMMGRELHPIKRPTSDAAASTSNGIPLRDDSNAVTGDSERDAGSL